MPFVNRSDAGRRLACALMPYRADRPVVLALPRGGVVVAAEVATALDAPLDLLLVRKLGVPGHRELAMGAVADAGGTVLVRNEDVLAGVGVSAAEFEEARQRELAEIERRRRAYLGDRRTIDVTDRTVIVIDDGITTGATMRAALEAIRTRRPAKLVLAVPVAPTPVLAELRSVADAVVCLEPDDDLTAIGQSYGDFRQIGDREVKEIMARSEARQLLPGSGARASDAADRSW